MPDLCGSAAGLKGQIAALKIQKVKLGNARREETSTLLRDLAAYLG